MAINGTDLEVKTFGWTLASLNTTQAKKLLKLEKLEVF
jgi:hypothetical protein